MKFQEVFCHYAQIIFLCSVSVVEPNIFIIIFFICYLQYLIFFNNVVALNYCSDIFGKR